MQYMIYKWYTIVCSKLLLLSLFDDFLKNTHTCERNTVKIDERENIQDIVIKQLSFFTHKSSQERKQISYGDL